MRPSIFLQLAVLLAAPFTVLAESPPSLADRLVPVADEALADVSVNMTITDRCGVENVAVVQSKRPALDQAVVDELSSWCFRSFDEEGNSVQWRGLKYFAFSDVAPDSPPVLVRSNSPISVPDEASLPSGDDEARNAFIENPADMPAKLPNEMWIWLPRKLAEKVGDFVLDFDTVVDADGRVVAVKRWRDVRSQRAVLGAAVAAIFNENVRFQPAMRGGQPVSARVRTPIRFYAPPDVLGLNPPEFPPEMLGNNGIVHVTYVCDKAGNVHDITVLSSAHPKFQDSVIEAFAKAKIKPAMRSGRPVAMRSEVRFHYETRGGGTQPFKISGGAAESANLPEGMQYDTPPKVKIAVDPVYPFELAREGLAGSAKVEVLIGPDGKVMDVVVAEASAPEFGLSLKAALQEWTFDPARKDGKPTGALIKHEHKFSVNVFTDDHLDAASRRITDELDHAPSDIVESSALDAPIAPLYQAQPVYPRKQLEASARDDVIVDFYIDHDGVVRLPHATAFHDEALAWAAATAVSRWRYEKPLHNGKPVDVHARVKLRFEPPAPADGESKAK